MLEVETFALSASTFVVPVVVTDKLVGVVLPPIIPDKVKLSFAVIVKACAPLIVPEIVCCPPVLTIEEVAVARVIFPE